METGEEFARKHAGKKVKSFGTYPAHGEVVGFVKGRAFDYVVVAASNPADGWPLLDVEAATHGTMSFTVPLVPAGTKYWARQVDQVLLVEPERQLDMSAYPHTCDCGAKAYKGFNTIVDCSSATCRHYKPFWLPEAKKKSGGFTLSFKDIDFGFVMPKATLPPPPPSGSWYIMPTSAPVKKAP